MADSQFNVERATNGLVLTLFLASAIFLGVLLLYVLRDMNERAAEDAPNNQESAAVVRPSERPPAGGRAVAASPFPAVTSAPTAPARF